MIKYFLPIAVIIIISGCAGDEGTNATVSSAIEENRTLANKTTNITVSDITVTGMLVAATKDACDVIVCNASQRICGDGTIAYCNNTCSNGACNECVPDCTGRDATAACSESWSCSEWSVCTGNQQIRRCNDANNCGTAKNKPTEARGCISCDESWSCNAWSACSNGVQTRTCSDTNDCGTSLNKPAETQTCCSLICSACEVIDQAACKCMPVACSSGDGCCPAGCSYANDSDCASARNIIINELLPNPTNGSEWFELYNPASINIDIGGLMIDDVIDGGRSAYTIPEGTTINASGFFVWETSSYFNNNGDEANLIFNGSLIDSFAYNTTEKDKSFCRIGAWQSNCEPTKGEANG